MALFVKALPEYLYLGGQGQGGVKLLEQQHDHVLLRIVHVPQNIGVDIRRFPSLALQQ